MSAIMDNHSDPVHPIAMHDHNDAESEVGDGSSSLSDIEQEAEIDDMDDLLDEASEDEQENDSEAETERLHLSPSKDRAHKDVVMTETHTFERTPSNLQTQYGADDDEEEDDEDEDENEDQENDDRSDDDLSQPDSPKSVAEDIDVLDADDKINMPKAISQPSAPKDIMHAFDLTNKKRKRSQHVDRHSVGPAELDEPSRKRTGSVLAGPDHYAIDDNASAHEDADTPNPVSGDLSDIESMDGQDYGEDADQAIDDDALPDEHKDENVLEDTSHKRVAREGISGEHPLASGTVEKLGDKPEEEPDVDDHAEAGVDDDVEAALKDEEEQERKRIALEQLSDIEKHFSSFRDRLYEERLAKLNHEEWMLKQDPPLHPEYRAMMQCIDARRDERLHLEERRIAYHKQAIDKTAVARRAQILSQFYQDVRAVREKKLELLGQQWYEIQHDRRAYGTNVDDYAIKFETKRQQQLKNQIAYNTEVSILSGIAKYRGFPAAPRMAPATEEERVEDFKLMGKSQQQKHRGPPNLPLQDIAAIRAAASAAALNPAEEQFIEQTPWANPKHPSHAHLLQRQASQTVRIGSPFSMNTAQPQKSSHPNATSLPISGTFSGHGFAPVVGRRPMNEYSL